MKKYYPLFQIFGSITADLISSNYIFSKVILLISMMVILSAKFTSAQVGPDIAIWYGDEQTFGQQGVPQPWVNILGNVSNVDGVPSLHYTLNGGSNVTLSIGPDGRRLQSSGDFNIDLATSDLIDGANSVIITATDNLGQTEHTLTVNYTSTNVWPLPYEIDWQDPVTVANEVSQAVDGNWEVTSDGIHTVTTGYDRLVAIGDMTWADYEISVPVTIHSISSGNGVGILLRWMGHTDNPVTCTQPKCGWLPLGAICWYRGNRLEIYGNDGDILATQTRSLDLETIYMFKARVVTNPGVGGQYSFKVWKQSETEPAGWDITAQESLSDPQNGSLMLISHHGDVTFGNLSVSSIPISITNVQALVHSGNTSATISWNTNVPASSQVAYGLTSAYELGIITDPTLKTSHSLDLTGLLPDTEYHYQISSVTAEADEAITGDLTFTTVTSDIVSDDFHLPLLNTSLWTFVDPVGDCDYDLVGSNTADAWLNFMLPPGIEHQLWDDGIQVPHVRQNCNNADFEVEAKFESPLNLQFQEQGILVRQDEDTFIRFEFFSRTTGTYVYVASFVPGNHTTHTDLMIGTTGLAPLYMRVTRQNDQWTMNYSTDGVIWTQSTFFTFALTVTGVGPYAGNAVGGSSPAHTGSIDYFFNTAAPVDPEDPISGEVVVITSTPVTTAAIGQLYTYDVEADGTPAPTFSLLTAPIGMIINSSTGLIEWTPDAPGNFEVSVQATNTIPYEDIQDFVIHVPYITGGIVSDDFNDLILDADVWSFIDPLGDGEYTLTGTCTDDAWINISVPGGPEHQMWENGIMAPHILQASEDTDFELEVKFESSVSGAYQEQGILVKGDESNFLRFEFFSTASNTFVYAATVTPGLTSTQKFLGSIGNDGIAPLYMRVNRTGNQWTQHYSLDDITWIPAANFPHTLEVTAVGTYAGNGILNNSPAHTSSVDYFFNTAAPVSPEDAPGPVTNTTTGFKYCTIQDAIDDASSGNEITVAVGSYTESLTINKELTINGIDAATRTLTGDHTITASNVTLSNFTFVPASPAITIDASAAAVCGVSITNSIFNLTGGGIGIWIGGSAPAYLVSNIAITDNIFNGPVDKIANPMKIGGYFGTGISCQVDNLDFTGNTVDKASIPLNLQDANLNDLLFDDNTFTNTDGLVYVWSEGTPTAILSNFVFTNNIAGNTNSYGVGIGLVNGLGSFSDANYGTGNTINNNELVNIPGAYGFVGVSILGATNYILNAENNWWGDPTGPYHATNNTCGQGSAVSDNVDFMPWWTDAGMSTSSGNLPVVNITNNPDTYYCTIQDAVVDATSGDEITVAAGTYFEAGQIIIDKNLTITGADKTTTILKPDYTTTGGSYYTTSAWIYVQPGVTFKLYDVTLDGRDLSNSLQHIQQAIQSRGELTVERCIVQYIHTSIYDGRGIVTLAGTTNYINDVSMNNIQRIGIHIRGSIEPTNPITTVKNFTYVGKGAIDCLDYGIEFGGGGQGVIGDILTPLSGCNITNCYGIASSDGSTSAGILITDYYGTFTIAEVYSSVLTNNSEGIAVGYAAGDISELTARNNKIYGNTAYGISALDGTDVDAINNWWGAVSGPYHAVNNTCGTGDTISDFVAFMPWWEDEAMGTSSGNLAVHNTTKGTYYCTIQDAVIDAASGNTIEVESGTFPEGIIVINKDLIIIGLTTSGKPIITPTTNTGSANAIGPTGRGWFQITGATVTLQNLVFNGSGKLIHTAVHYHGDSDGGTVEDCEFENIAQSPSSYNGRGINNYGLHVDVTNCTFSNIYRIGVFTFNPSASTTISGGTYTGKSGGLWLDYGVEVGNGATVNVDDFTVSGNTGVANDGSTSAGILVTDYFGPGSTANITNCDITGNTTGVAVGYDATDVCVVTINNNNISGNDYGVTSTAPQVDATLNWWGAASGPYNDPYNTCGSGNEVAGPVDFMPWWTDIAMSILSVTPGPAEVGEPVPIASTVECAFSAITPTLPTVIDYCGITLTPSGPAMGGTYTDCEGTITYTYTYTDPLLQIMTWVYTYTVDDVTDPVITYCPVAMTVYMNTDCTATGVDLGTLTATDNCNGTLTINNDAPTAFPEGNTPVTWTVEDCAGNSINCTQTITVVRNDLDGTLTYNNLAETPLNNVTLTLNETAATSLTDGIGNYSFPNLCAGTYTISVTNNNKPAGGINATDAAQVNYWGTEPWEIEKVRFYAGDATLDNVVAAVDASNILAYFVSAGTTTISPTWKFWLAGETISANPGSPPSGLQIPTVTIGGGDLTQDLYGLCTGDFNQSFIPAGTKSASESLVLKEGKNIFAEVGTELELPIVAGMNMDIGAVSLILNFPSDKVEISDVFLTSDPSSPLMYNIAGDELRIGWNSLIPAYLDKGESLITLYMKVTNESGEEGISLSLVADPLNELADGNFIVINDAVLIADVIHTSALGIANNMADELALANHPNPFKGTTNFVYSLPIDGKVILEIYDLVGNKVMTVVDATQTAGEYTYKLDANLLQPGVYTATLRLSNEDSKLVRTIKILSR